MRMTGADGMAARLYMPFFFSVPIALVQESWVDCWKTIGSREGACLTGHSGTCGEIGISLAGLPLASFGGATVQAPIWNENA